MDKGNIVVLMKTHVWNSDIETFAQKIYNETYSQGIDFFILMHTETDKLISNVSDNKIRNIIIQFTEKEIKELYPSGFYSMWLSSHWILMWFYKNFGKNYGFYWSLEYDVRVGGDGRLLWSYKSAYDFLYPMGNYLNSKNKYNSYYTGNKLSESQKYHGYLQIARYSNQALKYLNKCFEMGENGQDELITFSLLRRGKFTSSKKFLGSLIRGVWSWQNNCAFYNKLLYHNLENSTQKNTQVYIFHPVK